MAENPTQNTTIEIGTPFDDQDRAPVRELVEPTVTSPEAADRFSVDAIFEALSHPGRRYVLTYLLRSDGFVSISELVDYVTSRTDASMTDSEFRRRVTVELTNTHLPALAEKGFIRYNIERQIVIPTAMTELTKPYLTLALAQRQFACERQSE